THPTPTLFPYTTLFRSYFLFATTRAQLDFLRFPLGGMKKPDVRKAASALGLQVAAKPDSQDICFVPAGKYSDIVEKLRPGASERSEEPTSELQSLTNLV